MIRVTFIGSDGRSRVVEAQVGESLMQCAISHQVSGISGDCGGCASCGTCHAHVDPRWRAITGEASEDERLMLDGADGAQPDSRLICQIQLSEALDGLVLRVPAAQR